jgi:hypothetical protein
MMEKHGDITKDTPRPDDVRPAADPKTKQAADDIEDHLTKRLSDEVAKTRPPASSKE